VLPQELAEAIGRLSADASNGILVASGALAPSAAGSRVQIAAGQLTTIDGPFTETKEVVGGFAILEYPSRQEALASARRYLNLYRKHWPAWEGQMEVREILTAEDYAREAAQAGQR
jgi:hypothetical protein